MEGLGSSGRLVGSISTYPGTYKCPWSGVMAKNPGGEGPPRKSTQIKNWPLDRYPAWGFNPVNGLNETKEEEKRIKQLIFVGSFFPNFGLRVKDLSILDLKFGFYVKNPA